MVLSTLIQTLIYYFPIDSMLYLKIFAYPSGLQWIKDLLSVKGHNLFAVQGYSSILVKLVELWIWLPREALSFPLLEFFSVRSDRLPSGMDKIPCFERRKSSKWFLEVPFSSAGAVTWKLFVFQYIGDRWFQWAPDWRSWIHTCHSC